MPASHILRFYFVAKTQPSFQYAFCLGNNWPMKGIETVSSVHQGKINIVKQELKCEQQDREANVCKLPAATLKIHPSPAVRPRTQDCPVVPEIAFVVTSLIIRGL